MSKTNSNLAKRIRQAQQGGAFMRGTQTHKDKRNPSGKQLRKAFSSRQNRGIDW